MRLIILTSNQLRHRFFVNFLKQRHHLVGAVMESKKRDPLKKEWPPLLKERVLAYFRERAKSEEKYFGGFSQLALASQAVLTIEGGMLNDTAVIKKIASWRGDCLVAFGSSIIKKEILSLVPEKRAINMHLGLSPYYRGSGTNFWPLFNGQPQYVGVTIHFLDEGIDSGEVIVQGRPEIVSGDTPHSIGNKTIIKGAQLLSQVLSRIDKGEEVKGEKQDLRSGRLYRFDQCTAQHIVELTERWDRVLAKYLAEKDRLPAIKLINTL